MSATPLPSLAPGVSADALAVIPSRLLKRAEKLAADSDSWQVTLVDDGFRVEIGTTTVTYVENKFECSCLISPKCAHIGAVCMAAPIAAEAEAEDSAEPSAGGVDKPAADKATTDTDSAAQAAWAKKLPAVADIAGCVSQAQDITSAICDQGLANLSARFHMQLLALVRTTRVVGLPRLERAITALATLSQDARVGKPVARREVARQLFAVAMVAHLLDRDPHDRDAIGAARRAYKPLELSGAQNATFIPLYAEPIVTTSGFAGMSITLCTRGGDMFSITKTPPGDASAVPTIWYGPVRLGDMHCSHAHLARHVLLMSGGKGSADGRIGSGKGVRAALGQEVSLELIRSLSLPGDLSLVSGVVCDATLKELSLNTREGIATVNFSAAARRTNIRNLVNLILATKPDDRGVTCLIHGSEVVCLWPEDNWLQLKPEQGGRIFPGLDSVSAVAGAPVDAQQQTDFAAPPTRGVSDVLTVWLERCALGGRSAIRTHHAACAADMRLLNDAGAPYAAELLQRFVTDPTPRHGLSLVAYLQS